MKTPPSGDLQVARRNPLMWLLNGAALAPLLVILFSYLHSDGSMREVPVLLAVSVAGAMAGKLAFSLNKPGSARSWQTPLKLMLSLLLYGIIVYAGFFLVRLGPF